MGCTSLTSITIPSSVTDIYGEAFKGCIRLTSITIPDNVKLLSINSFEGCLSLTDVTISKNIHGLTNSFLNCPNLKNVTIKGRYPSLTNLFDETNRHQVTLYGLAGSETEKYASKNGIKFEAINEDATPTAQPAPVSNSPSAWAAEQVNNAIEANLVPQNLQSAYIQATTRAEFASLAVTMYETITSREITERKTFDDTTDTNVEKAAAIGVVAGVGDNKFAPDSGLTREQAAVMLTNLAAAIGEPLAEQATIFADNGNISSWAVTQVGQIQSTGIMSGVGNNTFDPQGTYTREQSIVTVLRLYDIVK